VKKGLPAKTHYKITNGIYDLFSDVLNKNGQNVRTDNNKGLSGKNEENSRHDQLVQNGQTRKPETDNQESPKWTINNTIINNTESNNTNNQSINHEHIDKLLYLPISLV